MFGILNIHKPPGLTSRQVVNKVQRLVRPHKTGHAGTLDPLASGVLVVPIGQATRLIEFIQQQQKSYVGTFLLGRESDTEDVEGEVRELVDPAIPTLAALEEAATAMVGEIQQRPPAYSALKVAGKRAYDLARQGKPVELAARPVQIYACEVLSYNYPELVLRVECGSGTYIRSLGRDLAQAVGTASVMSDLVRDGIGSFTLKNAVPLDELTSLEDVAEKLLPPLLAVEHLPHAMLTPSQLRDIQQGKKLPWPDRDSSAIAVLDEAENLQGIAAVRGGRLCPVRNFSTSE